MRVAGLRELSAGVDALYLSARASLPAELLERLDRARRLAEDAPSSPPFQFGAEEFEVAARGWGKYRYSLRHPYVQLGFTPSAALPSVRVQPRAEALHGMGAAGVVTWIRDLLEGEVGPARLAVTRLDLYADFQGWELAVDSRHECR